MSLTNPPAPAPQDFVVTELRGIIEVCGDSPTAIVSVERMRLWLSKLRAPVADNWQQYALPGETTAEQVCERMNAEVTRRTVAVMRASAPVAAQEFKAAFPNGALSAAKYHELWERASKGGNTTYTLLENMSWYIARFGELVAEEVAASAPVAGEAVAEVQIDPHSPPDDEGAIIVPLVDFEAVDAGTKLYAAPQASEAVRDAALEEAATFLERNRTKWVSARAAYEIRALKSQSAALPAQPGAQKGGSDEA